MVGLRRLLKVKLEGLAAGSRACHKLALTDADMTCGSVVASPTPARSDERLGLASQPALLFDAARGLRGLRIEPRVVS